MGGKALLPRPARARNRRDGDRLQLCRVSRRFATMISSSTWRCTVGFSIGTSASTRPSKLRGIQSAELMNTLARSDGSLLPLPKQTIRPCSRNRPMMLLTRMLSESPGTPGPQTADAAHDQIDAHPRLRCLVEKIDHRPDRRARSSLPRSAPACPVLRCRSRPRSARPAAPWRVSGATAIFSRLAGLA